MKTKRGAWRARQAEARRRRARLLRWGAVAALVVVGAGAFIAFSTAQDATGASDVPRPSDPRITLVAGTAAPSFVLPSTAGPQVSLSDYKSRQNVLLYLQEGVM